MKFNRYPKRDAIRNYFPMPNEIFSLGLSSGEILVYAYLMFCEDRKTYQCHPSYLTIGNAIGMSRNTVRKYVAGLEEKHLIYTEPTIIFTKDNRKLNGNLLYTIRPVEEAIQYNLQQQIRKAEQESAKQRAIKQLEEYDRKYTKKAV